MPFCCEFGPPPPKKMSGSAPGGGAQYFYHAMIQIPGTNHIINSCLNWPKKKRSQGQTLIRF